MVLLALEVVDDLGDGLAGCLMGQPVVLGPAGRVPTAEARYVLGRVRVDGARAVVAVQEEEGRGRRAREGRGVTAVRGLRAEVLADAAPEAGLAAAPATGLPAVAEERVREEAGRADLRCDLRANG